MQINDNNYMFTLKDAINLAKHSKAGLGKVKYESAVLGDYILTDKDAKHEIERIRQGKHLSDSGGGYLAMAGLPSGKLPTHVTFSDESPYAIQGLKSADAGHWSNIKNKDIYTPSKHQINRSYNYINKLFKEQKRMEHTPYEFSIRKHN